MKKWKTFQSYLTIGIGKGHMQPKHLPLLH